MKSMSLIIKAHIKSSIVQKARMDHPNGNIRKMMSSLIKKLLP